MEYGTTTVYYLRAFNWDIFQSKFGENSHILIHHRDQSERLHFHSFESMKTILHNIEFHWKSSRFYRCEKFSETTWMNLVTDDWNFSQLFRPFCVSGILLSYYQRFDIFFHLKTSTCDAIIDAVGIYRDKYVWIDWVEWSPKTVQYASRSK